MKTQKKKDKKANESKEIAKKVNSKKLAKLKKRSLYSKEDNDPLDISAHENILKDHEKSKQSFGTKKVQGFGLRPMFWEKDLEKIMPKERAEKLGYVR